MERIEFDELSSRVKEGEERKVEETKKRVMFVEFDANSVLEEISEIIDMARELQKKVDRFQSKAGTIRIIEAPEKSGAPE